MSYLGPTSINRGNTHRGDGMKPRASQPTFGMTSPASSATSGGEGVFGGIKGLVDRFFREPLKKLTGTFRFVKDNFWKLPKNAWHIFVKYPAKSTHFKQALSMALQYLVPTALGLFTLSGPWGWVMAPFTLGGGLISAYAGGVMEDNLKKKIPDLHKQGPFGRVSAMKEIFESTTEKNSSGFFYNFNRMVRGIFNDKNLTNIPENERVDMKPLRRALYVHPKGKFGEKLHKAMRMKGVYAKNWGWKASNWLWTNGFTKMVSRIAIFRPFIFAGALLTNGILVVKNWRKFDLLTKAAATKMA